MVPPCICLFRRTTVRRIDNGLRHGKHLVTPGLIPPLSILERRLGGVRITWSTLAPEFQPPGTSGGIRPLCPPARDLIATARGALPFQLCPGGPRASWPGGGSGGWRPP